MSYETEFTARVGFAWAGEFLPISPVQVATTLTHDLLPQPGQFEKFSGALRTYFAEKLGLPEDMIHVTVTKGPTECSPSSSPSPTSSTSTESSESSKAP